MSCIGGEQGEKIGDSWCFHCLGPVYEVGKGTHNTNAKWEANDMIGMYMQLDGNEGHVRYLNTF